jgi:hypothetical protein
MALKFLNDGYFAGKVGIGTDSPERLLSLYSDNAETTPRLLIEQDGTGDAVMAFSLTSGQGWAIGIDNSGADAFMIHNSAGGVDSSSQFSILPNGNVGIGTTSPTSTLTISSDVGGDGSWNKSGILIENTSTTTGEPTLAFRNAGTAGTGANYWHTGLNQSNAYKIAYGTSFTDGNTKLELSTNGALRLNSYTQGFLQTDASGNISTSGGGTLPGGPYLPLAGGTMTGTNGVVLPDNFILNVGTENDLRIKHNATNSFIENHTGDLSIVNYANDKELVLWNDDGTGGIAKYLVLDGNTTHAYFSNPSNVGIGTTVPGAKLHVNQSGTSGVQTIVAALSSTSLRPVLQFSESTAATITAGMSIEYNGVGSGADNYMAINSVTGSPQFVVMSGGNVGIGTTSPSSQLNVHKNALSPAITTLSNAVDSGNNNIVVSQIKSNIINEELTRIETRNSSDSHDNGNLLFYNRNGYTNTFAETMRITGEGKVGIGTVGPGAKLVVSDDSTTIASSITNSNSGGSGLQITAASGTNNILQLRNYLGGEVMRVRGDGNVGIGTTAPFTIGGTAKLSTYASGPSTFGLSSSDAVYLRRYGTGNYQFQTTATGGNNGNLSLQSYGGNVGIGTTSPGYKLQVGDNGVGDGNITMKANGNGINAGAKLTFNMNVGGGNADSYIAQIVPISFDSLSSGTHNSLNFKVGAWNNNADAGVSRMTILSNGNIGIGTTDPDTARLAVIGGNVGIGTTSPTNKLDIRQSTSSGSDVVGVGAISIGSDNPYWTFRGTATSLQDLAFDRSYAGTWYESMRIQRSTGNVGIGTPSPGQKLEVDGSIKVNANGFFGPGGTVTTDGIVSIDGGSGTGGEAYLRLMRGGTPGFILNHTATAIQVRATANIPMFFYTNDTIGIKLNANSTVSFPEYAAGYLKTDASGNITADNTGGGLPGGPYLPLAGGTITGNLTVNGTANIGNQLTFPYGSIGDYIYHTGDGDTFYGFPSADNFSITTGGNANFAVNGTTTYLKHTGNTKLITTSTGVTVTGDGIFTGNISAVAGTFTGALSVGT